MTTKRDLLVWLFLGWDNPNEQPRAGMVASRSKHGNSKAADAFYIESEGKAPESLRDELEILGDVMARCKESEHYPRFREVDLVLHSRRLYDAITGAVPCPADALEALTEYQRLVSEIGAEIKPRYCEPYDWRERDPYAQDEETLRILRTPTGTDLTRPLVEALECIELENIERAGELVTAFLDEHGAEYLPLSDRMPEEELTALVTRAAEGDKHTKGRLAMALVVKASDQLSNPEALEFAAMNLREGAAGLEELEEIGA